MTYPNSIGIPDIEFDGTTVGLESQGGYFHSQGGVIFGADFSAQEILDVISNSVFDLHVLDQALDIGGFSNTTITHHNNFVFWDGHFD